MTEEVEIDVVHDGRIAESRREGECDGIANGTGGDHDGREFTAGGNYGGRDRDGS
jgi:hypothetical protein